MWVSGRRRVANQYDVDDCVFDDLISASNIGGVTNDCRGVHEHHNHSCDVHDDCGAVAPPVL